MSKTDKLDQKFWSKETPKDFTWRELKTYLEGFYGYHEKQGKGSRVKFYDPAGKLPMLSLHKPHPGNIIKPKCMNAMRDTLEYTRKQGK